MRIVGSLTTIPSRIVKIEPIIRSILNQTRPLDALYINIPLVTLKGKRYVIPQFLVDLERDTVIILNRCKDYGPITKLVPTLELEKDPNTYIITFDDDLIVHKNTVRIFEIKIEKYPNAVLSFSGWSVGRFPFYFEPHISNTRDLEVDWVQGCHGIAYPRGVLAGCGEFEFPKAPKYLDRNDDHRISAFLSTKNIRKISIGRNAKKFFTETDLNHTDAISGNSVFNRLEFYWKVIRIAFFFKNKGLYRTSNDYTASVVFIGLKWCSLICVVIFLFTLLYRR